VDTLPFDATLLPALGHEDVPFCDDVRLRFSKWIPFARRNFAQTLGKALLAHPLVTVLTHANVAEVLCADGRAHAMRVIDYAGRRFDVHAEEFVIACGTIESARIVLSSSTLPDPHAQAGLYFHDHVSAPVAVFNGAARQRVLEALGPFVVAGTLHTCKLEASAAWRAQHHALAVMAHVVITEPEDGGVAAVRALLQSVQRGQLRQAFARNLMPMLRGVSDVARLLWAARMRKRRAVSARAVVRLMLDSEQAPRADCRIALSSARDALGLPKAIVQWSVSNEEQRTARAYAQTLRAELERVGLAPSTWSDANELAFTDTYHAMGGLRMGTDPAQSVVDRDLRVHGVANLSVASCAVFPSGGSSNPTFTLMALTLRLADRLTPSR
jgi:choline dehydrogenase-like flavoprotein